MPGWWVWGFILTIIFAFPYWAWYHMTDGHGIYAELEAGWAAVLGPAAVEGMRRDLEAVLRATHDGELPPVRPGW